MSEIDRFLLKVYDLFFTVPFEGVDRSEDEFVQDETEIDRAIKADRFALMVAVRRLSQQAQTELPLEPSLRDLKTP